ncbi:hypothetical protein AVEN_263826-1 [Araneus ventricosus]|uniref:Uncharacterized protein n=1 Tax=Araneus ventricosus TaxID=182803 RepID=A0A4Y2LQP7_ARAVE|nr:hypothetical protein AVEN_263826-1 [Araneus ventricosus]
MDTSKQVLIQFSSRDDVKATEMIPPFLTGIRKDETEMGKAVFTGPKTLQSSLLRLQKDNARKRTAKAIKDTLYTFHWEVLNCWPCNLDLSSGHYHVFAPLIKALKCQRFTRNQAVHRVVEESFKHQLSSLLKEGIEKRIQLWKNP